MHLSFFSQCTQAAHSGNLLTSRWPRQPLTRLLSPITPAVTNINFRCRWRCTRIHFPVSPPLPQLLSVRLPPTNFAYDYTKFASHYFMSGRLDRSCSCTWSVEHRAHVAQHTNDACNIDKTLGGREILSNANRFGLPINCWFHGLTQERKGKERS